MGLKLLIPETRRRRSMLRRERSSASACASCSSIMSGDQWDRVARARKSSRFAASARRPICSICAARLFLGWFVVAGELIVGLQVMRLYIDGFELGMTAEVDCYGYRRAEFPLAFTQQEGNRRCAGSGPFRRLADGETERRSTIEIEQLEQLCGLASSRFRSEERR